MINKKIIIKDVKKTYFHLIRNQQQQSIHQHNMKLDTEVVSCDSSEFIIIYSVVILNFRRLFVPNYLDTIL